MAARGLGTLILADSNILIDVIGKDPVWQSWSLDQLDGRHDDDIAVNQMVIAEVAPRFGTLHLFVSEMELLGIVVDEYGADAAFAAGAAFASYKRNRGQGSPPLPLPDFFIGGHAQVLGATVLTRDPRFYRKYFSDVPLITPSKDEND
jgi:predicted nucleic acid-binding protein